MGIILHVIKHFLLKLFITFGKITVDALEKLDYPVVMSSVLLSSCIFIAINILADVLYGVVDPRVKMG